MSAAPLVRHFQPLEQLESALVQSCREVTQAEHRFLLLLREFDLRRGCTAGGCAMAIPLRRRPMRAVCTKAAR